MGELLRTRLTQPGELQTLLTGMRLRATLQLRRWYSPELPYEVKLRLGMLMDSAALLSQFYKGDYRDRPDSPSASEVIRHETTVIKSFEAIFQAGKKVFITAGGEEGAPPEQQLVVRMCNQDSEYPSVKTATGEQIEMLRVCDMLADTENTSVVLV